MRSSARWKTKGHPGANEQNVPPCRSPRLSARSFRSVPIGACAIAKSPSCLGSASGASFGCLQPRSANSIANCPLTNVRRSGQSRCGLFLQPYRTVGVGPATQPKEAYP